MSEEKCAYEWRCETHGAARDEGGTCPICKPAPAPAPRINTTGCADPVPLKTYAEVWGEPNPNEIAALRAECQKLREENERLRRG